MTTRSCAWLMICASCGGGSRRLSVCSTAPMHGTAKYASRCSWWFQDSVPTRSPGSDAERAQRAGEPVHTLRHLGVAGVPGLLALERDDLAVRDTPAAPWRKSSVMLSGESCMVEFMGSTLLCTFWR